MNVKIDSTKIDEFFNAAVRLEQAQADHDRTLEALNDEVAEACRKAGFGYGAIVRHVHALAHYGNPSMNEVTSRVVNAFASRVAGQRGEVMLRIQLGSASKIGKFNDQYATIALRDIIACTMSSTQEYR